MIDIHTHVLPFVDDGSPDLEESVRMVREEVQNGVDTIIATPHHHYHRKYLKSVPEIEEAYNLLKSEIERQNIPVRLLLGQEIYYRSSEDVTQLLKQNLLLPLAGSRMILLEFSLSHAPEDLEEIIYSLNVNGYDVVIAHVERYEWMNYDMIKEIRGEHCKIQVNAGALMGKEVSFFRRQLLKKLIKENLVDFVASDLHSFRPCLMSKAREYVMKLTKSDLPFRSSIE